MAYTTLGVSPVVAPFDVLAETYDDAFTTSCIGRAQRDAVFRKLDQAFSPGQRILEINCGTGVDAAHLANRGLEVLACDASPCMIEIAKRRAARASLRHRVDFRVLATERIGALVETEGPARFDGLLSNFAGLNCVEDLTAVASNVARLLRPGAQALLCVFGRFCLWEVLWYLGHGHVSKAFRRFHAKGDLAQLAGGITLQVRYPSVRAISCAFAPYFRLRGWKGIGVAVPPSYLESWARRLPRVLGLLAKADRRLEHCPLVRAASDHVLLTFQRIMHESAHSESGFSTSDS